MDAQRLAGGVLFALGSWVRGAPQRGSVGLPLDVLLDERNVHRLDVVWYRHGRARRRGDPIFAA